MNDLRYAVRQLVRRPGFSLLVIVTLALGIGANTTIFSVLHAVLLRPLPYERPDELVRILGHRADEEITYGTISYPNFVDFREQGRSFAGMAAYDEWRPTLRAERPVRLAGASVSAAFFDVLGVRPALGRFFRPDEDAPGSARVVVLAHDLWVAQFGADSAVLGQTLDLSGNRYTVIGVLPAAFEDPGLSGSAWDPPVIWRPSPSYFDVARTSRGGRAFTALARLAAGVPRDAAQTELNTIMARLAAAYPEENTNRAVALRPLKEDLLGGSRTALWALLAGVGLVLLIACANVANLLLARAARRRQEIGVRVALGAARWQLARQLLAESLVLTALGGLAGVLLASGALDAVAALAGGALPRALPDTLDWRILAVTGGGVALAGILFGLVPLREARRVQIGAALKQEGRGTVSGRSTGRMRAVVGAQMALSLTLLIGAVLLARSLWTLTRVDPGIATAHILTAEVDPSGLDYPERDEVVALYDAILPQIAALPGVQAVGAIDLLPMSGSFNGNSFTLAHRPEPPPGERWSAETRVTTPAFFDVMQIPLVRGRLLTADDRADAAPAVVVTETFARRFLSDRDPVGVRIGLSGREWEVVGVVGDVRQFALDEAPRAEIYLPYAQAGDRTPWDLTVVARASGDLGGLAEPLRRTVWSVGPMVAVENIRPMAAVVAETIGPQRFRTLLFGLFAALALTLGAVGVYGVVSYALVQRTREVGIRMALGARRGRMVRMLVLQGMRPVLLGGAAGVAGGLAAGRALRSLLFEVPALDPVSCALAVALMTAAALAACWLPARRAARIDPMEALRHE